MQKNNKNKLSKLEKFIFFFLVPFTFLLICFTFVVGSIGIDSELPAFLELVSTKYGIVGFTVFPCAVLVVFMALIVFKDRSRRLMENAAIAEAARQSVLDEIASCEEDEEEEETVQEVEEEEEEKAPVVTYQRPPEREEEEYDPNIKRVEIKIGNSRPKPTVDEIIGQIDELRGKRRVTAKMIMVPAVKLEKLKNKPEYRADARNQARIRDSLNWCYEKLGKIEYVVNK